MSNKREFLSLIIVERLVVRQRRYGTPSYQKEQFLKRKLHSHKRNPPDVLSAREGPLAELQGGYFVGEIHEEKVGPY